MVATAHHSEPGRASQGRAVAVRSLVVAASFALVLALIVGYVRIAAVDSDQFANRATAALRDDSVRSLIADRVTDGLVLRRHSDLVAGRPLIQSVVSSAVGGDAFTRVFRSGVRDVHRAVFAGDQHTVTLTVADMGTIVAAGLEAVQPTLARRVETTRRVELLRRDLGAVNAAAARAARTVRVLAAALLLLAVACAAAALWLSPDRRRTVVSLGAGAAVGGVALAVVLASGRGVAMDQVQSPEERAAVGAIWDAFLGDLRVAAWILAGSGAVVAAAAASLLRPVDVNAPLRRAAAWITTEPSRPALRAVRGAVLVAAGLIVLLARDAVLQLLFTAAGVYLIFAGVSALLRLVYQPRAAEAESTEAKPRRRRLAAALVAGVLVFGAVAGFVGSGGTTTPAPAASACNGHVALCGRPFNEVALAASHNSMSAPLPGWFSSMQDDSIAAQLQFGIRGLLIDTHYADRLPNGRLRTYVGERNKLRAQARQDGVSPSAVDAALRIRDRLGFAGEGERGMYLCHSFCELGGTPLADVLRDLHHFLVANPGEVVVVINQDYVTPEDFVAAVREADLEALAYKGPTSGGWPTLREMVDADQRVIFLAENEPGAAPWYHPAYAAITQETPYAYSRPAQLVREAGLDATCEANRGPADAPLFLVNHWTTTDPAPLPSDADQVNAFEPLMRRLRECRRLRRRIPNLVAVNFYARGDLLRAVDALNGVR